MLGLAVVTGVVGLIADCAAAEPWQRGLIEPMLTWYPDSLVGGPGARAGYVVWATICVFRVPVAISLWVDRLVKGSERRIVEQLPDWLRNRDRYMVATISRRVHDILPEQFASSSEFTYRLRTAIDEGMAEGAARWRELARRPELPQAGHDHARGQA